MQRNEVIDLRKYRGEGGDKAETGGTTDELPAGTKILHGQYTITGYLNSGGFGITYRAKDSLGRDVVIKECFPGMMCFRAGLDVKVRSRSHADEFASMVKSFAKEALALAAMNHENIVRVHQVFEENETAYMAIDYVDGLDLLDVIEHQPDRLDPSAIEGMTRKTLNAIQYVHDRGMLHRDISPDNILLDGNDEPILIDFGSAREKAKSSGRVMSRLKFVKDGYSPQEFYVEGSEQGPWSDLYSLAASLYHLISGEPPEDGQRRMSALAQKQADPYKPLHGRIKGYSRGFLKSIDKALQVVPRNRFQSAEEWLGALKIRPDSKSQVKARERSIANPVSETVSRSSSRPISRGQGSVKPPSEHAAPVAETKNPASKPLILSNNGSYITPEEQAIRESLKGDLKPQQDRKMGLVIGLAAVSVISVVGTAGVMLMGGEETVADVQPTALPAETAVPETVATAPAAEPSVVTPSAPSDIAALPGDPAMPQATPQPAVDPVPAETIPPAIVSIPPLVSSPSEIALAAPVVIFNGETTERGLPETPPQPRPVAAAPAGDVSESIAEPIDLAAALIDATKFADLPLIDPAKLMSDVAPTALVLAGAAALGDLSPGSESITVALASLGAAPTNQQSSPLPDAPDIATVSLDTTPPAPLPEPLADGPLITAQVQYSHWDIDMPFTETLERVRNANTVKITDVSPSANLTVAGDWIADGVTLYSFNGEALLPDTPLSVHILTGMTIDPDGYARATVRYREPETGNIDRGLLAVPVVRQIGLADGTVLEARMVDRDWVITVVGFGDNTESSLRIGDQIVQETSTGIDIASHEDLTRAFDLLVSRDIETATFNVLRGGTLSKADISLSREAAG